MSILGTSNLEYHADRVHLSSSSLKVLLDSPEEYFNKYILGQNDTLEQDYFTEGSFVHSLILEPDKVAGEYAIFQGLRKSGKLWEEFRLANPNKPTLSLPQALRCEKLHKAYQALPVATALIKEGHPEHNMTSTILGVPVKARADYIAITRRCIIDVKTTSMPSDIDLFKQTVEQYKYHLSAALYCQIAQDNYGTPFDFYWMVLSKDDGQCHVYKAASDTLAKGTVMVNRALLLYKQCLNSGNWVANQEKISYDTDNYEVQDV